MSFCDEQEEKHFHKIIKLLRLFVKEYSATTEISSELKEKILSFHLPHAFDSFPQEKAKSLIPPNGKFAKQLKIPNKKDCLTPIFSFVISFLDLKDLTRLRKVNKSSYFILTNYLKNKGLAFEEEKLVRSIFSLDSSKTSFSLKELKEFCLWQIPAEARDLISLDYEEIQQKFNKLSKNDLKQWREIKSFPKEFDKIFRPFCRLFVRKPIFVKNSMGISEENWFQTFRKLIKGLIMKPEVRDLSYFLDLMKEEQIGIFIKDLNNFNKENNNEKVLKFTRLLECYKTLISGYFCENPFMVRMKTKEKIIEEFSIKMNEQLKLINFVRKIMGINEKMRVILDFKGIILTKIEKKRDFMVPHEILKRIYAFCNNRELGKMRSLSRNEKTVIEEILAERLMKLLKKLSENQMKIISFLGNLENLGEFWPKNVKEFNELKRNSDVFEVFCEVFPGIQSFDDFVLQKLKKHQMFHLKKGTLKKIKRLKIIESRSSAFDYFLKSLKLLYENTSKIDKNANPFELFHIIYHYHGLKHLKSPDISLKKLLDSMDNRNIKSLSMENSSIKRVLFKNDQEFLILTNKILPYMDFKDLYHWGLSSKLCRLQSYQNLQFKIETLQKKLKFSEIENKNAIKSLTKLRKLNRINENPSEELEHIENLTALECLDIRTLKSLNKFPRKYEIFMKPFLLLFPLKKEKFKSFQGFLKRKDLNSLINALNIELIPHEIIFLLEKYLYEYRDFFRGSSHPDKNNIYEKIENWLKALVGFYSNIRKYHVSYEEKLRIRFPEDFVKIFESLDKMTYEIFVYMKLCETFKQISENI